MRQKGVWQNGCWAVLPEDSGGPTLEQLWNQKGGPDFMRDHHKYRKFVRSAKRDCDICDFGEVTNVTRVDGEMLWVCRDCYESVERRQESQGRDVSKRDLRRVLLILGIVVSITAAVIGFFAGREESPRLWVFAVGAGAMAGCLLGVWDAKE